MARIDQVVFRVPPETNGAASARYTFGTSCSRQNLEAQDRDAPGVLHGGVQRDPVLLPRQHLAEPSDADQRGIVLADGRLERPAEAGNVVGEARVLLGLAAALEVVRR